MDAGVSGAGGAGGGGGLEGEKKKKPPEGEGKVKRKMKTALQLETLEKTYAVETYPSETLRADLSVQLGLSDRQLQMWFCHRRLKDRKTPPVKRPKKDASPSAAMGSSGGVGDEMVAGEGGNGHVSGSGSGSSPFGHGELQQKVVVHRAAATGSAVARIGADMPAMKRYYEPPQAISELRAIAFVEAQLGESLRDDGPILGMEFDPLPPGAFGAPIVTTGQQKPAGRLYEAKLYERPDAKLTKVSSRALHEYQFLPEQPSVRNDSYDRGTSSHHYSSPSDIPSTRTPASTSRSFGQANEQAPSSYGFVAHVPNLSVLPHQGRQANVLPSTSGDYNIVPSCKNPHANITVDPQSGASHPIAGVDNSITPPDRRATHDEEILRLERKRKLQSEEARIAREVEAHEKRIRKELEKQDILRRKREEQIRKEMERQDRERRKEEERLLREKQREEERFQREQRREMERREKFLQKETIRAEKLRIKEEMRREKEAARLKAANERATARRIAKESTELIDDERVELMDLAAARLGLPSVLAIDNETMQNLDSFRDMLTEFPPESVHMKMPFTIQPWIHSEENTGNLLMVWRFLITFADILGLWPFTLDEFVQSFHDYDSRLLGEIHLALLRSIIKDIEDVARTPSSTVLGANQHSAANPGGGHPHIVEGAYAWGFDIRSWQHHLNPLTWPEILRQFALSAGFGPKLKKRSVEPSYLRDENEGNDGVDVISTLRNGVAAENALAIMQERGYSNPRRSRHRLTPGTVKFAAFHVLSLEGSQGLTILEVADKIQKSGLRDLTTSKTPEASIAAALSRDTKLFERTAPSTYCVRTPYRKDPIDAETILSEAREKIQVFKNGYFEGEDADDVERYVERDEDSESDVAEDLEADLPSKPEKENLVGTVEQNGPNISVDEKISVGSVDKSINVVEIQKEESLFEEEDGSVIDESNCGELWVQALTEGEYSDLSVDERLNALVALIGVANEGNSIRIVLEERLEAANALKKQMWAEAQVDKRRMKEEYSTKMQYASSVKPEQSLSISALDGRKSPSLAVDDKSYLAPQEPFGDQQNDMNHPNYISAGPDNIPLQQGGYAAEKTRSQFKSLIGHKAEEMYVYRSLPLGQDRRRNRYWQFITSLSRNDPGSGRIFIELRNGHWRLIDSEESFDALLASLDVRGVRESNLLLMLQRIEPSFKETVRKNSLLTRSIKAETTSNPNFNSPRIIDSPNSTLESSSSFSISLGRNETEKKELSKRYQDFEKWMWDECFSASILGALKYGQMRCKQLLGVCEFCHDLYLFEQNHCPLCHKTFDSYGSSFDFDEHVALCKQKEVDLISCNVGSPDPLRIRLLKAQLALIEVSVLAEALEVTWSENYRETWGLKLHNATSAEGLLQILTLLETALKRDFLSLNFETTTELLSSSKPNGNSRSSISVLPWLPQTTSSVALRLMELDSSIFYTHYQKEESQRDKGSLDIAAIPTNFTAVKNVPNYELAEAPHEPPGYPSQDPWDYPGIEPTSSGRGRGRGRGSRGRTTRGGRPQKRVIGSTSDLGPRNTTTNKENFGQLVGWKGRARGRGGRKRGRRTARSRQKKRVTEISDERETSKVTDFDATPVSTEWNMEESTPVGAENVSSSDRSEYDDDEAGPPIGDEYDDLIPASSGYPGVYDNKPEYLMDGVNYGDEDEDDDDDDVDGEDFDEDEQMNVEEYFNGDSDEEEMRRDISSGAQIGNPDDITDSSSSSEYSD